MYEKSAVFSKKSCVPLLLLLLALVVPLATGIVTIITGTNGSLVVLDASRMVQVNGSFWWRFFSWHPGGDNVIHFFGPPAWLVPLTPFHVFVILLAVAYVARRVTQGSNPRQT